MVDSRKGGVMTDRIDHLTERVQVVEVKVDRLSSTVGELSTRVDGLSTRVDGLSTRVDGLTTTVNELATAMADGFVEQREYTEFSHSRLRRRWTPALRASIASWISSSTRIVPAGNRKGETSNFDLPIRPKRASKDVACLA